jgi:hypothetical protein
MPDLILSDEQAQIVAKAQNPIPVRDGKGNLLGSLSPLGPEAEIVAEAKRRLASGNRRISSTRVQAHLRALEDEWKRTGGFTREYLHAFLDRLRAEDGQ